MKFKTWKTLENRNKEIIEVLPLKKMKSKI